MEGADAPDAAPAGDVRPLYSGFVRSAAAFAARPALEVDGIALTYEQLERRANAIAAALVERAPREGSKLCGVFAYRSVPAFAGALGSLLSGRGYVPLNRRFPLERTETMLRLSDARSIVVDRASQPQLDELLVRVENDLLVVLPDEPDVAPLHERWPRHDFVGGAELGSLSVPFTPEPVAPDDVAYLLFTSGSTGTPKGVGVTHANIDAFLRVMGERWQPTADDRFSQTPDMTFDLSIPDLFLAWLGGACVCCPPAHIVSRPAKFINDSRITVWCAVPSVGLLMLRFGMLKPGQYPDVRLVLSNGEALPVEIASAWSAAAPNAVVENAYGPTEATVNCTVYRWDDETSPGESENGVVPIGEMNPGMSGVVVDEHLAVVQDGSVGELLVSGPQVVPGYWQSPEKTAAAFVDLPEGRFYRTGDLVRRAVPGGPLTYHGRVDHQVKISGHRVELGEVESVLRQVVGTPDAVAIGWPRTPSGFAGVVGFAAGVELDDGTMRAAMLEHLPDYMVPRRLVTLPSLPLNVNGKVDRLALEVHLENET